MTGKSFSVWLNNEYIPNNPDKVWIKEVYSKAVKNCAENKDASLANMNITRKEGPLKKIYKSRSLKYKGFIIG